MWPRSLLTLVIIFFLCLDGENPAFGQDAKCDLARKIGEEGVKRFKTDKVEGLKLLIKAQADCPEDAVLNFNLGLAYYRNGNLKEAEQQLAKAVAKNENNSEWLNLLAWVMLDNGTNRSKALEYAAKASKINPESPAISDTLIRACLENGKLDDAAAQAYKAKSKWPKDKQVNERYASVIDTYIGFYLKDIEAGEYKKGLDGLKKIDFDPDVANAYIYASPGKRYETWQCS